VFRGEDFVDCHVHYVLEETVAVDLAAVHAQPCQPLPTPSASKIEKAVNSRSLTQRPSELDFKLIRMPMHAHRQRAIPRRILLFCQGLGIQPVDGLDCLPLLLGQRRKEGGRGRRRTGGFVD
jgi:hypothetical protein